MWFWNTLYIISSTKAGKTETLDLCQLTRPPYQINKMINLLATRSKFSKNKLKNWETDNSYFYLPLQAKRNNKLIKLLWEWFRQLVCLEASLVDAVGKFRNCNWYLPHLILNFQVKHKHLENRKSKLYINKPSQWWVVSQKWYL